VPNTVRIYSCLTLFFGRRKIVCWFNKSIEFRLKLEICSKNRFHSGQIRILFKHPARLKNLDTIVNKILIIFAFKRTIKALILTITPKNCFYIVAYIVKEVPLWRKYKKTCTHPHGRRIQKNCRGSLQQPFTPWVS
jgi:hypothetical protein